MVENANSILLSLGVVDVAADLTSLSAVGGGSCGGGGHGSDKGGGGDGDKGGGDDKKENDCAKGGGSDKKENDRAKGGGSDKRGGGANDRKGRSGGRRRTALKDCVNTLSVLNVEMHNYFTSAM